MALRFRNTNGDEYVRTTNLPATSLLTVLCAVKVNTFKGLGYMWSLTLDANNLMSLNWGTVPQNMSAFVRIAGTSVSANVIGRVVLNTWMIAILQRNAAAGTITAGLAKLYGNDQIRFGTNATTPTGNYTPDLMEAGDQSDFAGNQLDSDVACMRIWTAILTTAQIERERQAIAAGMLTAVRSADLHADYPFINPDTAIKDFSPNAFDWTAGTAMGALGPTAFRSFKRNKSLGARRPSNVKVPYTLTPHIGPILAQ